MVELGEGKLSSILRKIYREGKPALTRTDAGMIVRTIDNAFERLAGKKGLVVLGRRTVVFDGEMAFVFPKHKKVNRFIESLEERGLLEKVSDKPKVYIGDGAVIASIAVYRNEVAVKRRWSKGIDEFILEVLADRVSVGG